MEIAYWLITGSAGIADPRSTGVVETVNASPVTVQAVILAITMVTALLILAITLVTVLVVHLLLEQVLPMLERTDRSILYVVVARSRWMVLVLIPLSGVFASLLLLDMPTISPLPAVVTTVAIVVIGLGAIYIGRGIFEIFRDHDRSEQFVPIISILWTLTVVLSGLLTVMYVWGVTVAPLLASAGVLTLIFGYAARDTFSNIIAGITLFFDGTYRVGDFIVLETGDRGTVTDISLRSTTLLTRDQVSVVIPNSNLSTTKVINESTPQRHKRIRVPIQVAYGTDVERLRSVLLQVAAESHCTIDPPRPRVHHSGFGDSGLDFELRVFISNPLLEAQAVDELNASIYDRLALEDIEIPYPQHDLRFRETPALWSEPLRDGEEPASEVRKP